MLKNWMHTLPFLGLLEQSIQPIKV